MMAETVTVTDNYGTYYYINSSSASDVLTQEQQDANALYIRDYCNATYPTWTVNAVAAMCGNFAHEGVMNPSQWQYGLGVDNLDSGFGLGQWTPASKLINWLTNAGLPNYSIPGQIARVDWESQNNEQWIETTSFPLSMAEFLVSEDPPADLASAWLYDWERPADPGATEQSRKDSADYYYELFGNTPINPKGETSKGLKPCFYHRFIYD